jgi:hypothetical protein
MNHRATVHTHRIGLGAQHSGAASLSFWKWSRDRLRHWFVLPAQAVTARPANWLPWELAPLPRSAARG